MGRIARYLTHPQVVIDPDSPVELWGLNEIGAARVARLTASGALVGTTRLVSSAEVKAIETAQPLAEALGCVVEIHEEMGENDRRATGFLPGPEFEATADLFFAQPRESARGWERAIDAQTRIHTAVLACLESDGDLLFTGHGAVGSLLYCALAGIPISRQQDQFGGGGCVFSFDPETLVPDGGWQPMEALYDDAAITPPVSAPRG